MKQNDVLRELGRVGAARRGRISEQWYERAGKDGEMRRTGPYYVWQRFIDGQKVSVRVPQEEAAQAMEEIERGQQVEALIGQFWRNAEAEAESKAEKKTAGRLKRMSLARNCVKPLC